MTGETVPHLPPPTALHCSCLIARSQKLNTCKATKGNVLLSGLWVAVNRKGMCRDARGPLILLGAEFTIFTTSQTQKNTFQSTLVQLNKNGINDHRVISHQREGLTQEMFGKALMKY